MARYIQEFPIVEYPEKSYAEIANYLTSQKFEQKNRDGEVVFQKGDGVWLAAGFVKVSYSADTARVEAWIDVLGEDQDLEGFVGSAAKKPLKKNVTQVEYILQRANPEYLERKVEGIPAAEPMDWKCAPQQELKELPASKKEFYEKYAGEGFYRNLKINAIIGYVLCGIGALTALLNPYGWIDVAIYLALLLGMHLKKSKLCAIGITIYAVLGVAVNLVLNALFAGYLWLIVGIYSVILFNKADKRYKDMMGK